MTSQSLPSRQGLRRSGLLLVGHGTRSEHGTAEFFELADHVARQSPGAIVQGCFLELAQPTIAEAVQRLAGADVRQIVVVPLMLLAAGHVRRDIPRAVAAAAEPYPDLHIHHADALDCHQAILQLSALRFRQAAASQKMVDPRSAMLVMVGRGSSDPSASGAMHQFVERRARLTPVLRATTCFLAKAEPSLTAGLAEAAASEAETIIVQPHLLFAGQLLDRIGRDVDSAARRWSKLRWSVTEHLGPAPQVAEAVTARFAAAQLASACRAAGPDR